MREIGLTFGYLKNDVTVQQTGFLYVIKYMTPFFGMGLQTALSLTFSSSSHIWTHWFLKAQVFPSLAQAGCLTTQALAGTENPPLTP